MNLSSLSFWSNLFGWIAVSATALGAVFGSLAWWFTVQRDNAKDEVDSRFRQESTAKIAASDLQAAEATRKAEEARLETARVSKETALANRRAGELELQAIGAKKDLLEMQERLKSRRLTLSQRANLTTLLSQGEKGEIRIITLANNTEAIDFATDLSEVLTAGGWIIKEFGTRMVIGRFPLGLTISATDEKAPRALALSEALKEIGYSVQFQTKPQLPADTVILKVGAKA